MSRPQSMTPLSFLGVVALSSCVAPKQAGAPEVAPSPPPPALDAEATLTVYPFMLGSQPMAEVGGVVGVLLEQRGHPDVRLSTEAFAPKPGQDLDAAAQAFGAHVARTSLEDGYALYGQYLGTAPQGLTEIRIALVDHRGRVMMRERWARGDAAFDRAHPRDPMSASVFVAERLRAQLGLPDPAPEAERRPGRLERQLMRQSGLPEPEELEGMKPRHAELVQRRASARFEVRGVQVGGAPSHALAAQLAGELERLGLAVAAREPPSPVEVEPSPNQAQMLWALARGVKASVERRPPEADYVVYADCILRPDGSALHGAHLVVCDREGAWVLVDLQNSHHPDFQAVAPRDGADCVRLVAERFARYLEGEASP